MTNRQTQAVAEAIRNAVEMTDKQYIWRRTLDKKAYEVIYWPDPDVAANDECRGRYFEMEDAAIACGDLKTGEIVKAAIAASDAKYVPVLVEALKDAYETLRRLPFDSDPLATCNYATPKIRCTLSQLPEDLR